MSVEYVPCNCQDIVVLVFSFNEQNIAGTEAMAQDLKENPFLDKVGRTPSVLLLPSRKELGQIDRLRHWERIATERLTQFISSDRVSRAYGGNLKNYIREAAVQYVPYFNYGEDIAAESDKGYEQVEAFRRLHPVAARRIPVHPEASIQNPRRKRHRTERRAWCPASLPPGSKAVSGVRICSI